MGVEMWQFFGQLVQVVFVALATVFGVALVRLLWIAGDKLKDRTRDS